MLATAKPVAGETGIDNEADQGHEVDPVLGGEDRQVGMPGI
jgi:hypothetical protein